MVVRNPFVQPSDTGERSVVEKAVARQGIIRGHQAAGKVATYAGSGLIAYSLKPTLSREYVSLRRSEVKKKGIKPQPKSKVVYRPENDLRTRSNAKHFRYMHGARVTKGPRRGQILRGDDLRYYNRKRRASKVGKGLVAYGQSSKAVGYAHAYAPLPKGGLARGLNSPWAWATTSPEEYRSMAKQLESDVKRTRSDISSAVDTGIGAMGTFGGIITSSAAVNIAYNLAEAMIKQVI